MERGIFTINPKLEGRGRRRGACTMPGFDEIAKIEASSKEADSSAALPTVPVEADFSVSSVNGIPNPNRTAHFIDPYVDVKPMTAAIPEVVTSIINKGV